MLSVPWEEGWGYSVLTGCPCNRKYAIIINFLWKNIHVMILYLLNKICLFTIILANAILLLHPHLGSTQALKAGFYWSYLSWTPFVQNHTGNGETNLRERSRWKKTLTAKGDKLWRDFQSEIPVQEMWGHLSWRKMTCSNVHKGSLCHYSVPQSRSPAGKPSQLSLRIISIVSMQPRTIQYHATPLSFLNIIQN